MISLDQYFKSKPHTPAQSVNAVDLLYRVNALLDEAAGSGAYSFDVDCDTGSNISGSKCGAGDGGFRRPDSTTGSKLSSHRQGRGIDVYDPNNKLDDWLTDAILANHDLYRESPDKTLGWCHLSTRKPPSGRRTFLP